MPAKVTCEFIVSVRTAPGNVILSRLDRLGIQWQENRQAPVIVGFFLQHRRLCLAATTVSLIEILNHRIVQVSHEELGAFEIFYFGFNAVEAVAWFAFAVIVLRRWYRQRKTWLEAPYSLLFLLFGISDVIEIIFYPLWLLVAKAVLLAGLLLTRRHLIRVHYEGKWF